jgi:carotenoid cleavage dioxygenase-like enzyme
LSIAHPHFDRARGRQYSYLLEFSWKSRYHVFSTDQATGHQAVLATIPVGWPAYMHSFGMTERHLVLTEFPLVVNPLRLKFSRKPFIRNYVWEPERGIRFHIIDKETGQVVRTARSEAFFAFHHVNAFAEGDTLCVDIVTYPDPSVIDQLYLDRLRSSQPVTATGKLTRFRVGASGDVSHAALADNSLELPRFNYRRLAGRPYRFVYGAGNQVPGDFIDNLVKVDLNQGTAVSWYEEGCYPGEPVFVATPEAAAEDAGVILSVVLDVRKAASFMLIPDAVTLRELARAEVPHHIPFGFHGNYLAAPNPAGPGG